MLLQTSVLFLLWQVKIPVVKKEYSLGDSVITRIKVSTDPQSEEMMSCCTMQVTFDEVTKAAVHFHTGFISTEEVLETS